MKSKYFKQLIEPLYYRKHMNSLNEDISKLHLIFYKTKSKTIRDQIEPRLAFLKDLMWLFQNKKIKKRKVVKIIQQVKESLARMMDFMY